MDDDLQIGPAEGGVMPCIVHPACEPVTVQSTVPAKRIAVGTINLNLAPASSLEWDSLNLEYPPGVTDRIYTTAPPPSPDWDGLQLEYPPEVSHLSDQIEKTSLNPVPPSAPGTPSTRATRR
ncbi:hypothetical protein B0H14DRAFT_2615225 [Mycena olivaceomarginata]|nr:hypothetical protein B0H14DRAFT_2615225 [Mycena olivaceomarginata]